MIHTKVSGRFMLSSYKIVDGKRVNERVLAPWFSNIITNQGLDRMANYADWITYCHVGSGNTTPAASNIGLAAPVAVSPNISMLGSSTIEGSSPYTSTRIFTYTFSVGVAAGNLSEVGVGWGNGLGVLFSRALIVDLFGDPTTITVLSDEYLEVKYQLTYYPIITDTTGTVVFTGNKGGTFDFILRRANVTQDVNPMDSGIRHLIVSMNEGFYYNYHAYTYSGNIGPITSVPSGSFGGNPGFSIGTRSYTAGTYTLDRVITIGLSQGNTVNGLRCISFGMGIKSHQIQFDNQANPGYGIPKTSDDIVTLTIRQTWGRV